MKPKGLNDSTQGFNPELFTQLGGETADSWKTSRGGKRTRLEAYATLVFRTVERSLRAFLVASS
jgi:hypothetical protein